MKFHLDMSHSTDGAPKGKQRPYCRAPLCGLRATGADRTATPRAVLTAPRRSRRLRDAPPLARRHAVTRLRLGRWRLAAPVLALSEIAAGACAQALLELKHHAAMLDLIALLRVAPALAARRIARLQACAGVSISK
jgi:hypothetical protein